MDYYRLLDLATDLGYELALSGAEISRVEDSIIRLFEGYGVQGDVFAIPNCIVVSVLTDEGKPFTRMRRVGIHGTNLDALEKFSDLSRRLCTEKPEPSRGFIMLEETKKSVRSFTLPIYIMGYFFVVAGFGPIFGCSPKDIIFSALCGTLTGLTNYLMDRLKVNPFFNTVIAAFISALAVYLLNMAGLVKNADGAVISVLMLLVPGMLFTNAMKDIIYGDINSGMNRIVQVILTALAIAMGTAAAWNVITYLFHAPTIIVTNAYPLIITTLASAVAGTAFSVIFNTHSSGRFFCALGCALTWLAYIGVWNLWGNELTGYFFGALTASVYSETMARVRKIPAITYLAISLMPLFPGAGVYYTMTHALWKNTEMFVNRGAYTAAIAGVMAVGILVASTAFRSYSQHKRPVKYLSQNGKETPDTLHHNNIRRTNDHDNKNIDSFL